MITQIKHFIKSLTEKALGYDDTQDYVMIREMIKDEIKIILYNYLTQDIVGYITANRYKNQYYIVNRVSAEKGWGPFMYDLLLQSVYPLGVKPSHMIRPDAISIWNYYLTKNSNIETSSITDNDPNYATEWQPDEFVQARQAPEQVKIINTIFKIHPYAYFHPFIQHSEKIIKEQTINKKTIFKNALDYFQSKYYAESYINEIVMKIPEKDITDKYLLINRQGNIIEFLIQDKSTIFAYAELTKKDKYYQTNNVAAKSGWGPFLYDCIMLMLEQPIHPSTSLTQDSYTVINTYLQNRPDVIKDIFPGKLYTSIDFNHRLSHDPKLVKVLNYTYTIHNSNRRDFFMNWYQMSLSFEEQMITKIPKWKEIRFNQAKRWFNLQYMAAA